MLEIIQLAVLNDNYIYMIHDPVSGETGVVDPAISEPVLSTLQKKDWSLDYIFNTHHHWDHIGANLELKQQTHCQIVGFEDDKSRIPGIDIALNAGDRIQLGGQSAQVIATPGHTIGHIMYYFEGSSALFCGDTLFSMGCGRLFEGSAEQMWHSLQQIKSLPAETLIYCAHEYTQDNAKFAISLEPDNPALQQRIEQVNQLRSDQLPTIPSTVQQELATNPFLRSDSLAIKQTLNMVDKPEVEVFKYTRELKDNF